MPKLMVRVDKDDRVWFDQQCFMVISESNDPVEISEKMVPYVRERIAGSGDDDIVFWVCVKVCLTAILKMINDSGRLRSNMPIGWCSAPDSIDAMNMTIYL